MKKLGIIFILMVSLISCSSEDAKTQTSALTDYYGKWTLIKITGSKITTSSSDTKTNWKETYVFNTDGTFLKTRIADNTTITAAGTFKVTYPTNEILFELTFNESSSIVGSCLGNKTENLNLNKDNLLISAWQNCDGWGLIYQKS